MATRPCRRRRGTIWVPQRVSSSSARLPASVWGEKLHAVVVDDSRFAMDPKRTPEERLERALYQMEPADIRGRLVRRQKGQISERRRKVEVLPRFFEKIE